MLKTAQYVILGSRIDEIIFLLVCIYLVIGRQFPLTSLVLTVRETLRYRGSIGQWSWVLHRLTGLGVVFFLVLHVIDTSWAAFYPALYVDAIAAYQSPLFTIGEFGLVAAVVYHALNGLRIILFDYKPEWWKYQQKAAIWVLVATGILLVPVFIGMLGHVADHYFSDSEPFILPLGTVILDQAPFIVGIVLAIVAAIILSGVVGMISGNDQTKTLRPSQIERFWWSFMRVSGLLILPLVFGHLAMMHILQGVFDLQFNAALAEHGAIGAVGEGVNASGTAVEFVADRWNTLVAGVAVWRVYDVALLVLVTLHGFNGLRYVLTDYTMSSPLLKRAMIYLCIIAAIVLLVTGGGALLSTIDEESITLAQEALNHLYGTSG